MLESAGPYRVIFANKNKNNNEAVSIIEVNIIDL